ncbi:MAG: hypothetical protein IPI13_15515 [Actinomycetales bacterium]|uniref:Acyl-CoA thioesterase 2 C-terminal domain-containing protein n=1 Tax=Candidatus Phosphoribacter hodrii TaxID=2953743 RepID=A0A935MB78_9MICO|nr:hypothetical protein [Candidatus Phosphoribacter hodrii]
MSARAVNSVAPKRVFQGPRRTARHPVIHAAVLAHASDSTRCRASAAPPWGRFATHRPRPASLDHAMWFPLVPGAERLGALHHAQPIGLWWSALGVGRMFSADGALMVSVAQEVCPSPGGVSSPCVVVAVRSGERAACTRGAVIDTLLCDAGELR